MPRKGQIIKPKVKIICLYCGKEFCRFPSQAVGARYCSFSCRSKAHMATVDQRGEKNPSWKGGKRNLVCKNCGKEFFRRDCRSKNQFCSTSCGYAYNTKERFNRICQECGKEFSISAYEQSRDHGLFCSKSCAVTVNGRKGLGRKKSLEHRTKIGLGHTGEKNYRWKGGVKMQGGYTFNRVEKGKYKQEHRQVAEKAMGRPLTENEHVHHINGNKTDNRNCNLLICSRGYHAWLHRKMGLLFQSEHFLDSGSGTSQTIESTLV